MGRFVANRMPADNQKHPGRSAMIPQTSPPSRFSGCDVSKTSIVVFDSRDRRTTTVANRPDALAAFAAALETPVW
jgi:hypothetical protein